MNQYYYALTYKHANLEIKKMIKFYETVKR